jgi:hypothetical protein
MKENKKEKIRDKILDFYNKHHLIGSKKNNVSETK